VPSPKVHLAEPGILTVEEAEALFRKNEKDDPEICGLLALGAFAGMRASAICGLSWDELDFKNRAILTPAAKIKKVPSNPSNAPSPAARTPSRNLTSCGWTGRRRCGFRASENKR
jgi:integrase